MFMLRNSKWRIEHDRKMNPVPLSLEGQLGTGFAHMVISN